MNTVFMEANQIYISLVCLNKIHHEPYTVYATFPYSLYTIEAEERVYRSDLLPSKFFFTQFTKLNNSFRPSHSNVTSQR